MMNVTFERYQLTPRQLEAMGMARKRKAVLEPEFGVLDPNDDGLRYFDTEEDAREHAASVARSNVTLFVDVYRRIARYTAEPVVRTEEAE